MNEREMLEFAAKAAGYEVKPHPNNKSIAKLMFLLKGYNWNPITDDGDALRLAVKLSLEIDLHRTGVAVRTGCGHKVLVDAEGVKDGYAAARIAITRAAAEIGKAMP